jgi:2-keto-3-deoxy-L-rhamnonate aldolase RhmA
MRGAELRQALHNGQRVYGVALENPGQPFWPKFFSNLGLDYVWLESEHTPSNRETLAWAFHCYAAYGIAPLLRIPEISATRAAMGLDDGAHGILVPYVETVEQVKPIVGAVKSRPLKGKALHAALNGKGYINEETERYILEWNKESVLIIMIESPTGVENLSAMLDVGGIDAVLIGPHDLSISLGVPEQYHHPRFIEAYDEVMRVCKAHRVGAGMHFTSEDVKVTVEWCKRGANLISYNGDTLFVSRGIQNGLTHLRQQLDSIGMHEQ